MAIGIDSVAVAADVIRREMKAGRGMAVDAVVLHLNLTELGASKLSCNVVVNPG